jgi:ribosomal-protein-serine acetyltransferase
MVTYETFEPQHLDGIMRLCAAEGWESYQDAAAALWALTAPGSIVVAAIDQTVVGFVQLQTDGVVHAHVSNVLVAPSHRRRGVGRRLLEAAFERSGARYLDLVSSEGAHDFYRSFEHKQFPGFRIYLPPVRSLPERDTPATRTGAAGIRFYAPADAPALVAAARESTADVFPWLPWCHPEYSLAEARLWIEAQIQAREQRLAFEFVITEGDRFAGGCGLNQINPLYQVANLGYWVRSSSAGRGVAPAAVGAVARWAFANTELQRIEILVAVGNRRSQRVAEKAGAQREGMLRSRLLLHARSHDAVVYSLVRSWEPRVVS